MCTVNSLGKYSRLINSLGTILFFTGLNIICFGGVLKNSSCAHLKCSGQILSTVTGPADLRIFINSEGICDTTISVPPALITLMPGCSLVAVTTTIGSTTLNSNGGIFNLRTGIHKIIYCLEDNCRSTVCDTAIITILDSKRPDLSCMPDAVVSLNSEGIGEILAVKLDGGSFDNCGHVYFKAKRMTTPSTYLCTSDDNPNYFFDNEVKFCCEDIGHSPILVRLRAYDIYPGDGIIHDSLLDPHFVECMVQITVIDKTPPDLDCPVAPSILCSQDIDSVFNSIRPAYYDNCSTVRLDSVIVNNLNACGYGTIERTFIATDQFGQASTCTQELHILKNTNFNGLDTTQLKWPSHKTIYACRINIDTIQTGEPEILENECDQILIRKSDNLYYFNRGGVCGKLLRFWEVINYCVYNKNFTPNPNVPENGYYSFYQEIKIIDTIPPEILNATDTTLYSVAADCGFSQFRLPSVAALDCGSIANLSFKFEVDYFSDGTLDRIGNGPDASGIFPMGNHTVSYIVKDSCNNINIKNVRVSIKDGKAPSAIVLYGLSTSLQQMSLGIMAMVNAKQFNSKSEDNCTTPDRLKFSFSNDIKDTLKSFNCDDIGVKYVDIYVWDEANNYSVINSFITVFDLNNLCPNNIVNVRLFGNIVSVQSEALQHVEIHKKDSLRFETATSSYNGSYAFADIPKGMNLALTLFSNENPTDGISTSDIIKIQQHIIGKKSINNVYELIAADIDMNGKISSVDISYIRKMILGIIDQWPTSQSFVFIDRNYQFKKLNEPWNECAEQAELKIRNVNSDVKLDFIGIKLGDVNSSLKVRNNNYITLEARLSGNRLNLFSNSENSGYGFQFIVNKFSSSTLSKQDVIVKSKYFDVDYSISNDKLIIILSSNEIVKLNPGSEVLEIELENSSHSISTDLEFDQNSEWINSNLESSQVKIVNVKLRTSFSVESFGPNPVKDELLIKILVSKPIWVNFDLIGADGRIGLSKKFNLIENISTLRIDRDDILNSGMHTLRLYTEENIWTQKIFIK
ncbi:MAG: hypothetical protein IT267_07595 [Saprospiraceae bacterium]|nr:hypothetical protein [Saprospiraceae bacterium]